MYSRLFSVALLGMALSACAPGPASTNSPAQAARPTASAGGAQATSSSAAVPATEPPVTMHVAGAGVSGNLMTPWATYEGGYFKKYNLDVDGVPDIAASTTAVQAVIARDLDVLNITPNAAIEASLKGGADLVAIANPPPGTGFWLYAPPQIHSLEDLRGKIVAANQVGTSTYYAVDYAFRERGMVAGRDYEILSVGNQAAQLAALEQGTVQAGVYSAPTTAKARKAGMVELLDLNYVPFNANSIIVRREMLDDPKGRDALTRFMKAIAEGIARVRQDKPFAVQVLQKYLKEDDPEALDEVYTAYLPKRVPLVSPEALPPVLESIAERDPAARSVKPERYYDNSIVQELQASGFIDSLYR
jgi:ABC-type nitrate/sulfonate/bicarbonate transport system substrate-binding protein